MTLAEYQQAEALAERLHALSGEAGDIMRLLPAVFEDMAAVDAAYCRYNLQHAAMCLVFAANRITSPTGSAPVDH